MKTVNKVKAFSIICEKKKETFTNAFAYSNFNCLRAYHFSSRKGLSQVKKIQERSLRLLLKTYTKNYEKLLKISGKSLMEIKLLSTLVLEIFETHKSLNFDIHKNIFAHLFSVPNIIILYD